MQLFSHTILRQLSKEISQNKQFSVMVDGTQDVTGKEQECVCIRHVDLDLSVREDFIGLYELPDTRGETMASMVQNVFIRVLLPI